MFSKCVRCGRKFESQPNKDGTKKLKCRSCIASMPAFNLNPKFDTKRKDNVFPPSFHFVSTAQNVEMNP